MKFTIKNSLGVAYEALDPGKGGGSHVHLIKLLQQECLNKGQRKGVVETLANDIFELKEFRRIADYDNVFIDEDDSEKAYNLSVNLQKQIKTIFKI